LDAAMRVKSLPVMPSRTSLEAQLARYFTNSFECATYILALCVLVDCGG
jgi:hypothetical protein